MSNFDRQKRCNFRDEIDGVCRVSRRQKPPSHEILPVKIFIQSLLNNDTLQYACMQWKTSPLSLSLPEREIGVKMTYGPVGGAPMSIPAFKFFKTDYF